MREHSLILTSYSRRASLRKLPRLPESSLHLWNCMLDLDQPRQQSFLLVGRRRSLQLPIGAQLLLGALGDAEWGSLGRCLGLVLDFDFQLGRIYTPEPLSQFF